MYEPDIPQEPEDGGNVTYTISNNDPPRSAQTITRLPPAIELRTRPDAILSGAERRADLGDQVFTISQSSATATGSAKKQFEIGQVLEFVTDTTIEVDPMRVSATTLIRHDTNLLDLGSLGLSEVDIDKITGQAESKIEILKDDLNVNRKLRKDTEIAINENKKTQNETRKALDAVNQLVVDDPSLQSTIDMLEANQVKLKEQETALITQANDSAEKAFGFVDDIRQVAQVVR